MDEDPGPIIYLVFTGLLLLSAFFSAAEVAFVSLSPAKVRALREERPGRATDLITKLKSRPHRLLTTILIGNNLVNIFTAGLATVIATQFFGSAGLGIATGGVTIAILVFGEIVPKGFAQRHAVSFASFIAYPLFLLEKLLTPINWSFEKLFHAVGVDKPVRSMTEEELLAAVEIGTEEGEIKHHEQEMIQNILEFTDTRVEEVMTPRVAIKALEQNKTIREATEYFIAHSHSRLPVYDETIDKVQGIVSLRDILEHRSKADQPVGGLIESKPIFTPASRPIRSLFQEFKSRRVHLAIVVDEHGGTLGLVTLEDLLEEIVGEIEDEEDIPEDIVERLNSRTLLAPADTQLTEIDDKLETKLSTGEFESKNLAFLLLEKLGRLPKKDDKIRFGSAELTIEGIIGHKIKKVKIEKL